MTLYLPVIYGTVRDERESIDVARYVTRLLEERDGVETRLVDPRDLPFGNLVDREWEMDPRPPEVAAFVEDMARADGFVIVTPEYNYGVPGALKNLLDHLYDEWNRKPFAMVGCGGVSGGLRALDNLRQIISGLGAFTIPRHQPVQFVGPTFDANGPVEDEEKWRKRFNGLFDELEWYAAALKRAREAEGPGGSEESEEEARSDAAAAEAASGF